MNKIKNKYFLKVAIIFSFLSCLIPIIFWHCYLFALESQFVLDEVVPLVLSVIYLIQSGIYLLCYGLGHCLNFNIRPLISFFSFGDLVFILGLCLFFSGFGSGDNFYIFKNFGMDLYFVQLFISKFGLKNIMEKVDEKNDKE